MGHGVNSVAIMSNNAAEYPEDSFDNMRQISSEFGFSFPYLVDETQQVAKAYGAVCTPDFFGYNGSLELQYRGVWMRAVKRPQRMMFVGICLRR